MDKIARLRQEIERLKGICTAQIKANPGQTFPFVMEMTGYDKLLSFLNTLSEEPDKSLEEEIETWIPAHISVKTDETLPINPTELAKTCKEWGKCIARHYIRKDALLEWMRKQIEYAKDERIMNKYILAYKDIIEKINSL
jgi:hypothetical protein